MKTFALIGIALLLLLLVPVVGAQQPTSGVDNACEAGGSMAGKCTSEWHWTCGWYVARYERGEFSLGQVPADCAASLIVPYLPPTQVVEQFCTMTTQIYPSTFTFAYAPGSAVPAGTYAVASDKVFGGGAATEHFADYFSSKPAIVYITPTSIILADVIASGTCGPIVGDVFP